jgi:hypothetical protein
MEYNLPPNKENQKPELIQPDQTVNPITIDPVTNRTQIALKKRKLPLIIALVIVLFGALGTTYAVMHKNKAATPEANVYTTKPELATPTPATPTPATTGTNAELATSTLATTGISIIFKTPSSWNVLSASDDRRKSYTTDKTSLSYVLFDITEPKNKADPFNAGVELTLGETIASWTSADSPDGPGYLAQSAKDKKTYATMLASETTTGTDVTSKYSEILKTFLYSSSGPINISKSVTFATSDKLFRGIITVKRPSGSFPDYSMPILNIAGVVGDGASSHLIQGRLRTVDPEFDKLITTYEAKAKNDYSSQASSDLFDSIFGGYFDNYKKGIYSTAVQSQLSDMSTMLTNATVKL